MSRTTHTVGDEVPSVGVPAARSARTYAFVGLGITFVLGFLVWDILGTLGAPFAVLGLVGGVRSLPRTTAHPKDRRAAMSAIGASIVALGLLVPIWIGASDTDEEPPPSQSVGLQATLDAAIAELEIDGASVTVIGPDGERSGAVSGIADRGTTVVDATTRFAIASITKTFTTVTALRLAERGVVDLDAPVDLDGVGARATLRDLLGHTAGLRYEAVLGDAAIWTSSAFEEAAAPDGPCEPGECYSYSDLGFVGAGLVLQRATDQPIAELLRAEILEPLGLEHTELLEPSASTGEVALLDRADDAQPVPELAAVPLRTWTAGAIVTTADDLARFARALFDGELLEPASLAQMQDIDRSATLPCPDQCMRSYGLGLEHDRAGGHDAWGHEGSSGAVVAHFPAERVTIAVLTTRRGSGRGILHEVMNSIAGLEDRGDIFAVDVDGSGEREVVVDPLLDGGPAWSPDGERIVFGSVRDGNPELYLADAGGGHVRRLTDDPAADVAGRWSPDGSTIVFASDRGGDLDLYAMDADGDDVRRLTDEPIGEELPNVSPDGQRIVFNIVGPDVEGDIGLVDIDGGNRQILDLPGDDWAPSWSPDGSSIAFLRGGEGIWVMDPDGSNQRQLSPPGTIDRWPVWGPDGRIAFVHGGDLWTMADDGSDRRQVTDTVEEEFVAVVVP